MLNTMNTRRDLGRRSRLSDAILLRGFMRSQTGNIPYPIHLHGPLGSVKNTHIFHRSVSSAKTVTPEYWRVAALVVRLVGARVLHADQADEDRRGDRESMDVGVENVRVLEIVRMKLEMTGSRGGDGKWATFKVQQRIYA